jgi:hypothetical protein
MLTSQRSLAANCYYGQHLQCCRCRVCGRYYWLPFPLGASTIAHVLCRLSPNAYGGQRY